MNNKNVNDCFKHAANAVAEDKAESKENAREENPGFAHIHLEHTSTHSNRCLGTYEQEAQEPGAAYGRLSILSSFH